MRLVHLPVLLFALLPACDGKLASNQGGDGAQAYTEAGLPIPRTDASLPQGDLPPLPPNYEEIVPVDVEQPPEEGWPMAGAGPQRHSWTTEEVRGRLVPQWFRPIEPYISGKVQIVATGGLLYVSTARGLYALQADTGEEAWRYPTALPLGHAPTVRGGILYVGGFDGRVHALDAKSGAPLWTYQAGAGFATSPVVENGLVFAACRDGHLYAIHAAGGAGGQLGWKFKTGGPLNFSPAYAGGMVYIASDDGHAYAVNGATGQQIWKSQKLPGSGFHSFWPVVYGNHLVIAGTHNYRHIGDPFGGQLNNDLDREAIFPHGQEDPKGTLPGPLGTEPGAWAAGTVTVDLGQTTTTSSGSTNAVTEYYEQKPWRRTYLVLNRFTGEEYTTDFDKDGKPEYPPIQWFGTHGGANRNPPTVGVDGVLYQTNAYLSDPWICGGQVSGWRMGSPLISVISSDWGAVDEVHAHAGGGKLIYWHLWSDSEAGAYDITIPNAIFAADYNAGKRPPTDGENAVEREWRYFSYNLSDLAPGHDVGYRDQQGKGGPFGGPDGIYPEGDVNPPIPYQGKVFLHVNNAVIAFAPESAVTKVTALPLLTTTPAAPLPAGKTKADVTALLEAEVQRMVAAGHLRPGYVSSGILDVFLKDRCGDELHDYWHHPADTIITLAAALPHLSPALKAQAESYLQAEFKAFPPHKLNHIGWRDGAAREVFDLPPEVEQSRQTFEPRSFTWANEMWKSSPIAFYAGWKYAQLFGGAAAILDEAAKNSDLMQSFKSPLPDSTLTRLPHLLNATIAGTLGYLELEKLAGRPSTAAYRATLDRLLALRVSGYTVSAPDASTGGENCRSLNAARNFISLVPELAAHLRANALPQVQATLDRYDRLAPYWFVAKFEAELIEGNIHHLYDRHAIFLARALVAQAPFEELARYLDVPAVATGDLFYLQNLVVTLEAK